MNKSRMEIAAAMLVLPISAMAGYVCPAKSNTAGGWLPPECAPAVTAIMAVVSGCDNCGTVESVGTSGGASGLGAVAGAVAGGAAGTQVGKGKGKILAAVVGAAAGAAAGHYAEKALGKSSQWDVVVLMDDGSRETKRFNEDPGYKAGDKVLVLEDDLVMQIP